jgi:hypothetical protein
VSWRKAEVKDLLWRESIELRHPTRKQKGTGKSDEEVNPVPASGRTGFQGRGAAQPLFRRGSNSVISQYYVI